MPSPKQILVVMRSGEWRGGAEWALWHLLEHAREREVTWIVAFLEEGALATDVRRRLGVDTRVIQAGRVRNTLKGLRAVRSLRRLMLEERVDLVLSWMADSHIYAAPAAVLANVPAWWYQHWIPAPSWVDRLATFL